MFLFRGSSLNGVDLNAGFVSGKALVPQFIVEVTPKRKSLVALVFLPSFPSMCLAV